MRIITRNDDNAVVMYSLDGHPSADDTQTLHDLSPSQAALFTEMSGQPNGGITFDGSTFTLMPPLVVKPVARCTPWQFRKELRVRNLKEDVDTLVAASDIDAQDAYACSTSFDSDNKLLLLLASRLPTPLSEDDVYQMVLSASKRVVGE